MKQGFSALELVISLSVGVILMSALLMLYRQVITNMDRVDRYVRQDTQILVVKNRFEKDLAGLSAIWYTKADLEKQIAAEKNKQEKIAQPIQEKKSKEAQFFYSVDKNKNLDYLTFITTNPLLSYGSSCDRFARVVYKIEQDKKNKDGLRLLRKEIKNPTESIEEKDLEQGRFYELLSGITSLEMTYYLIDKKELAKLYQPEEKKDGQVIEKKLDPKKFLRSVKQWNLADAADKDNKKEKESADDEQENFGGAATPRFIEMKIGIKVSEYADEKIYTLWFSVPVVVDNSPKKISPKKDTKVTSMQGNIT